MEPKILFFYTDAALYRIQIHLSIYASYLLIDTQRVYHYINPMILCFLADLII